MKKYSILIVGLKCYSGHIREFIVNLKKKNPQVEISLVATDIKDGHKDDIEQAVNQLIILNRYRSSVRIPFLSRVMNKLFYCWAFLRLYFRGRFDIVDIHFPTIYVNKVLPFLKRMTNNIVITPWGSDVLRVEDEKSIKGLTKIFSPANYVTVSKESQIGKCILTKFGVNPQKMVKLGWGGEFFDYIQECSSDISTEEAKARFGLNGRYVITCGYNTQRSQRHEDIMNAINNVKKQLPNNLTILIPCTYVSYDSLSEQKRQYVESLKKIGKTLGLDVVVVEEHLDLPDLFKLRMATDIFVHVQTTDGGSRSVMEYVFCNKKIVHGEWIKYVYLDKFRPSCYFPLDKMENLADVIAKAYRAKVDDLPQGVRNMIIERGWGNRMTKWNDFFESIV